MFEQPTVFILGAGASWHYGYPTGEDLVKRVIATAKRIQPYFQDSEDLRTNNHPEYIRNKATVTACHDYPKAWNEAATECKKLIDTLEAVDPLVIDYFLSQNEELQSIGKLMIAWVIFECETRFLFKNHNENRLEVLRNSPDVEKQQRVEKNLVNAKKYNDNWCRFILHQLLNNLQSSEDLRPETKKNNVKFITFNYDTSLETQLRKGLEKTQLTNNKDHIDEFIENNIIHIYGKTKLFYAHKSIEKHILKERLDIFDAEFINFIPYISTTHSSYYSGSPKELLNEAYIASKNLQTIGGSNGDKHKNTDAMEVAKAAIANAKVIYILGYGFDERNNELLGLKQFLAPQHKKTVMFTNFENSERINKKAGVLFWSDPNLFSTYGSVVRGNFESGRLSGLLPYYERSVKNVYDAFAYDFDAI